MYNPSTHREPYSKVVCREGLTGRAGSFTLLRAIVRAGACVWPGLLLLLLLDIKQLSKFTIPYKKAGHGSRFCTTRLQRTIRCKPVCKHASHDRRAAKCCANIIKVPLTLLPSGGTCRGRRLQRGHPIGSIKLQPDFNFRFYLSLTARLIRWTGMGFSAME